MGDLSHPGEESDADPDRDADQDRPQQTQTDAFKTGQYRLNHRAAAEQLQQPDEGRLRGEVGKGGGVGVLGDGPAPQSPDGDQGAYAQRRVEQAREQGEAESFPIEGFRFHAIHSVGRDGVWRAHIFTISSRS
jgi:hypothetical protein